jgi:hypothetical protein
LVGDIGTHAYHLIQAVSGLDVAEFRAEIHVCGAEKPVQDTARPRSSRSTATSTIV